VVTTEERLAAKRAYYAAHREEILAKKLAEYAAKRAEMRARKVRYYAANPGPKKARDAIYRASRRDEARATSAAWRAAHPGANAAALRQWYAANRQRSLSARRAWDRAHPEQVRERHRRDKALRRGATLCDHLACRVVGPAELAWQTSDHVCWMCGVQVFPGANLHMDHVVAIARGGLHCAENLRPACADCNLPKGVHEITRSAALTWMTTVS